MRQRLYDWDKLIVAGARFKLRRGHEYDCSQSAIVQQIRNAAAGRDKRAKIKDTGRAVVVEIEEQKAEPCPCA